MGTATTVHGGPGLWLLRAGHRHGRSSAITYARATTHGLPRGPDRRAKADGPSPLTLCPQDPLLCSAPEATGSTGPVGTGSQGAQGP